MAGLDRVWVPYWQSVATVLSMLMDTLFSTGLSFFQGLDDEEEAKSPMDALKQVLKIGGEERPPTSTTKDKTETSTIVQVVMFAFLVYYVNVVYRLGQTVLSSCQVCLEATETILLHDAKE